MSTDPPTLGDNPALPQRRRRSSFYARLAILHERVKKAQFDVPDPKEEVHGMATEAVSRPGSPKSSVDLFLRSPLRMMRSPLNGRSHTSKLSQLLPQRVQEAQLVVPDLKEEVRGKATEAVSRPDSHVSSVDLLSREPLNMMHSPQSNDVAAAASPLEALIGQGASARSGTTQVVCELGGQRDTIVFDEHIAGGASSEIYKGTWKRSGGEQAVTIKVGKSADSLKCFATELRILKHLDHPNIIKLIGSIDESANALVFEYCDGGDLCKALKQQTPPGFFIHATKSLLGALEYVHGQKLMHRDVKSPNVLMTRPDAAAKGALPTFKLADFGVCRDMQGDKNPTGETGSYRWMAPEVLQGKRYDASADVYSVALVLYELLTHHLPFDGVHALQAAYFAGVMDKRPLLPDGTPASIAGLIECAWSTEWQSRPSAAALLEELNQLESTDLTVEERGWLDAADGHPITEHRLSDSIFTSPVGELPVDANHTTKLGSTMPEDDVKTGWHLNLINSLFDYSK